MTLVTESRHRGKKSHLYQRGWCANKKSLKILKPPEANLSLPPPQKTQEGRKTSQWDVCRRGLGFASVGSQLVCHRQTLTPRKGFPIE